MVKPQEYITLLLNVSKVLPLEMCEKIVYFIYSYTFKDRNELKDAINDYPNNINVYGNISYWNVSNIIDMSYMFHRNNLNEDISNWDISSVINMRYMFSNSIFNQDISTWDISNVEDISYMFFGSKFNKNNLKLCNK